MRSLPGFPILGTCIIYTKNIFFDLEELLILTYVRDQRQKSISHFSRYSRRLLFLFLYVY